MLRRACFRLAALFAATLVAGCAEPLAPPAAPTGPLRSTLESVISTDGVLELASPRSLLEPSRASKRILAAEGGWVELAGYRVDIPAGALPADTTITIELPTSGSLASRLVAEFGPHGVQFNTPVTLTFPLTGVLLSGEAVEVARWEDGAWRGLGGAVSADGLHLTGQTPHFSTYGGKYVLAGG